MRTMSQVPSALVVAAALYRLTVILELVVDPTVPDPVASSEA